MIAPSVALLVYPVATSNLGDCWTCSIVVDDRTVTGVGQTARKAEDALILLLARGWTAISVHQDADGRLTCVGLADHQ